MGMDGAKGKNVSLNLIIKKLPLFIKYLGFSVIYTIAIIAGFFALIIPGIYLATRFGLAPYLMIDNDSLGLFDALKLSGEKVKGKYLEIIFSVFVIILVSTFVITIFFIISSFIPGTTTPEIIAKNAFSIIPSTITMAIIYVGFATIYFGVTKK